MSGLHQYVLAPHVAEAHKINIINVKEKATGKIISIKSDGSGTITDRFNPELHEKLEEKVLEEPKDKAPDVSHETPKEELEKPEEKEEQPKKKSGRPKGSKNKLKK